ncbi:Hypothetical protein HVR_LOCUS377 [uncultured virus]|nr:Hypothetical protein HVR_LOCUS377 [uncultured virus]
MSNTKRRELMTTEGSSSNDLLPSYLPLIGKSLNVLVPNLADQALDECLRVEKILGLDRKLDYSDDKIFSKLEYERFKILSDKQSTELVSTFHAFFEKHYPSLIKREFLITETE